MELTFTVLNISTWWSSLDVNYQTVIISGGISFLILGIGCAISEAIRRRNKSTELTQYKEFIEEWVTESLKTLDLYISFLLKFSDDIKKNKGLNVPPWTSNIIHLSEIYKIPLERYANIYIFGINSTDYKGKRIQLMSFLYQLEYLDKAPSLIMNTYNRYRKHNEEIMSEWNKCHMNLTKLYSNINYKDNPAAKRFYLFFKNAIDKYSYSLNLDIWESEYIQPTMDIIKKENPSPESILFQIAIHTEYLNNVIKTHNNLNKYSESFADHGANLETSRNIIASFKSYFDKEKIKRFCK